MALVAPGAWLLTSTLDVRLGPGPDPSVSPPGELSLHIGAARTTAKIRLLNGRIARLTLREPLPLRVGDRVLLRVPGAGLAGAGLAGAGPVGAGRLVWPPLTGATVLDVTPSAFRG